MGLAMGFGNLLWKLIGSLPNSAIARIGNDDKDLYLYLAPEIVLICGGLYFLAVFRNLTN